MTDQADAGASSVGDLSIVEVRVLGCLVEKQATTPDSYPLTINSLRNACNQSTSRDPVMALTEFEIEQALTGLRQRRLTRTVHSTSNRATKFRHVMDDVLQLDPAETALVSVLMLRGPQTVGELKTRSERQHQFDSVDTVGDVLARLASRPEPLVVRLERQPGQKDARWVHLLGEHAVSVANASVPDADPTVADGDAYGTATAEFYDLLATDMWDDFGLQLLDLLDGVDPSAGPIVDVGAGTGVGLPAIRAAVPGVRVFAIEPSRAMRAALHARLHDTAELADITTVSPTTLGATRLPARASALVASAVLGHLTDSERRQLWRYIADCLPVGAPAVVGVLPPDHPIDLEPVCYHRRRVGEYTYEGWQSGSVIDERMMSWTLGYRVLDSDGGLVAEYQATAPWRCDSVAALGDEIGEFGLSLTEHTDCVVIRRLER